MKKILFALLIIVAMSSFCSPRMSSLRADEIKTFIGTIESFQPTFGRPPKWPIARFTAVAESGEKIEIYVLGKDTTVIDIDGKSIENKRPQVGKKVEVKYSTGAHEIYGGQRYEAISVRYIPADHVSQLTVSTTQATAPLNLAELSKNTFIGRIDRIVPNLPKFTKIDNCEIKVIPDNGEQYMYFKLKDVPIIDVDGKSLPMNLGSLEKGKRVEVKYSDIIGVGFSGAKTAKAVSMRYVPLNYIPQPVAQSASAQAAQGTSAQPGDTFVGTIESFPCGVGHFKSGPPLWPMGMIVVIGNNGEKNNFLIVNEGPNVTILYDADGKAIPIINNIKTVIGKRVEVKYAVTAESMRYANKQLAISVRYVSQDYVPRPGISTETGKPNNPVPQSSGQGGVNLFTGTIEYTSHLSLHLPPGRIIRLSSDKGDKLTVFVSNDIAIRDMAAAPTRIGKRAEVKYSPSANGENEAISFRYLD